MQLRKTLIAVLAVAIAVAMSPITSLQAASLMGPGSQPAAESVTHTVKAKKAKKAKVAKKSKKAKKAKKAKKGKKAASKGPGRCGTGKYWDRKKRSCASKT